MNQGHIYLDFLEKFVLDEADRMLDMGFIHDLRKIIAQLPEERQTLFFSATMPKEIAGLANRLLNNPVKVEVTPVSSTAETVEQSVYFVNKADKKTLLIHLLNNGEIKRTLVFTKTKHGADRLSKDLNKANVRADALHGDKTQSARERALANFKAGRLKVLVATDIAARGIDVDDLTHVINYDIPNVPETYVHRIGRTGRAGANGTALSFCDREERVFLKDIHKLIAKTIPVVEEHPYHVVHSQQAEPAKTRTSKPRRPFNRQGSNNHPRSFNRNN
jgi:ATP-dependent RNA helicase RhlE